MCYVLRVRNNKNLTVTDTVLYSSYVIVFWKGRSKQKNENIPSKKLDLRRSKQTWLLPKLRFLNLKHGCRQLRFQTESDQLHTIYNLKVRTIVKLLTLVSRATTTTAAVI